MKFSVLFAAVVAISAEAATLDKRQREIPDGKASLLSTLSSHENHETKIGKGAGVTLFNLKRG